MLHERISFVTRVFDDLAGSKDILLDKNIVAKILDIQKLKENDRQHVFVLLDAFLKQTKLQSIM